jgi:tRNA(Ile)-lysidine synthase
MDLRLIIQILHEECCINCTDPLVVGVSGGPDSLSLAHLLFTCGIPIIVAHLDHQLRSESGEDASFVKTITESWKVPFVAKKVDVMEIVWQKRLSIEEAGRIARYQFLFDVARQNHAQAVVTAHTADDQVETMLMHLLRGSGLNGLKGMKMRQFLPEWDSNIPLVRPLLHTWRSEIIEYCTKHNLQPIIDKSNLENTYFRNRLRNELIPYLQTYNPNIKKVLLRSTITLSNDHDLLQDILEKAWKDLSPEITNNLVKFQKESFLLLQPGVQSSLFRRMIAHLIPQARDFSFDNIQRGLSFIRQPTQTNQLELEQGIVLRRIEDDILITNDWSTLCTLISDWFQTLKPEDSLTAPGGIPLANGKSIRAEVISAEAARMHPAWNQRGHAFLDEAQSGRTFMVRNGLPGDRFKPLGMHGNGLKLSNFWINEKLPREARALWPLICAKDEIIWIPGFRTSHQARVTENTANVIHLWVE